jgi:hypothetical protein
MTPTHLKRWTLAPNYFRRHLGRLLVRTEDGVPQVITLLLSISHVITRIQAVIDTVIGRLVVRQ